MANKDNSSHGRATTAFPYPEKESTIYQWRCANAHCQQVNQTCNDKNCNWHDRACKGCGGVTGKEVCLLQVVASFGVDAMEDLVRKLYKTDVKPSGGP